MSVHPFHAFVCAIASTYRSEIDKLYQSADCDLNLSPADALDAFIERIRQARGLLLADKGAGRAGCGEIAIKDVVLVNDTAAVSVDIGDVVTKVCSGCGSEQIARDAVAVWSIPKQDWVLQGVHDSCWCDSCGGSEPVLVEDAPIMALPQSSLPETGEPAISKAPSTPHPDEPTNLARAARIDVALREHQIAKGEEPNAVAGHLDLADLLADARHWCDHNDVDWRDANKLAFDHYLAEQPFEESGTGAAA